MQTHRMNCDVLVAGGGAAGVPCALAAARCGAKVILCQDRPVLGGNASSEIRMHISGANGFGRHSRGIPLETEAREGGIIEEIRLENCVRNPQRSPSMADLILYDKCRQEPNLTLLLNTTVVGLETTGSLVTRTLAQRQSTEDCFEIEAKAVVDCTGDGRLGVEAGVPFMHGRESRHQYDESLAQETEDGKTLGSSLLIVARRHDRPMPFVAPPWARKFSRQDLRLRLYSTPGEEPPALEYGFWWAEWGGDRDTIKENEDIRDGLLAVVLGIWDHIKNGPPDGVPGPWQEQAAQWALDWFGFLTGKRESRRFLTQYVLTQADVLDAQFFDDAIAYGGWSLDLHPPEGVDAPDQEPCIQHAVPYLYSIPLRSCIAPEPANLMFAGRNIGASHVAFSSTRVMATCAMVGQGVGTAAAYAAAHGIWPRDLAGQRESVRAIQQRLLRDDAYLIGYANEDPDDLARQARISASSFAPGGEPQNVVSGQTRSVHGERGALPELANPGIHRWMSDPNQGLPAWLQLDWDRPVDLSQVQLIFDTGLHRHLTLSYHDGYTASMLWGRPQPETVCDYSIEVLDGVEWRALVQAKGNYQRRRVHGIGPAGSVKTVRVNVHSTNGLNQARVCQVRLYAEEKIW